MVYWYVALQTYTEVQPVLLNPSVSPDKMTLVPFVLEWIVISTNATPVREVISLVAFSTLNIARVRLFNTFVLNFSLHSSNKLSEWQISNLCHLYRSEWK